MTEQIDIGGELIPVVPQSHARVRLGLPRVLGADRLRQLAGVAEDDGRDEAQRMQATIAGMADVAYDVLAVLAPHVSQAIPRYRWQGYTSQEAMDAGEIDDAALDAAPTIPQVLDAITVALRVNGIMRIRDMAGLAQDVSQIGGTQSPPDSGRQPTPT